MDTRTAEEKAAALEKVLDHCKAKVLILRLYVANNSPSSVSARCNIEALCDEYLKDSCSLEVIDICKEPRMARKAQIVATPTLVKMEPLPVKRFVGNMSNRNVLLAGLGLEPH